MTTNEQSPMTREDLIFELGRCQGMLSRINHDCEKLIGMPNTETREHIKEDITEARALLQEQWRRFYGLPVREEEQA